MEKYSLIRNQDCDELELSALPRQRGRWQDSNIVRIAVYGALALSFCLNILSWALASTQTSTTIIQQGTKWANLVRNVPVSIYSSTEYGPSVGTQDDRNRLWNALDISPGTLALSDDYARDNGLPLSQRFPWDESKGIYILGAFHQMHCLIKIQKYTSTAQAGLPQEDPDLYEHVEHCLDSLLQDVYCHADDTPWYELPAEGYRDRYDKFQTRTCKSWDGLLEWADQYNACYKNDNVTDASGNELENVIEYYTYCPKNSPYKEAMIEHFREEGGPERKGFWEEYGGR